MPLDDDTFWAKYAAHVNPRNAVWREKRRAVMKRCRYQCEGCHKQRARHVHHLTYDRLGHELLEDLQALCHECHAAVHPHRKNLQRKVRRCAHVVVAQPETAPSPAPPVSASVRRSYDQADQRFDEAARAVRRRQRRLGDV